MTPATYEDTRAIMEFVFYGMVLVGVMTLTLVLSCALAAIFSWRKDK